VENHGGTLEVMDNEPRGTIFLIYLPTRGAE
jgi:signal transduction histidine kinase